NFSHRTAEQAKPLVERIRKVADQTGVFIGVLGDLRGPRIRVGEMENGSIELQVLEIRSNGDVLCEILRGGELKSNKGVNLKNRLVSLPSLTTKDYLDLDFAVSEELDFLALSFVQSSSDVRFLKQALAERGASIPVIAKIERKNALDDIEN